MPSFRLILIPVLTFFLSASALAQTRWEFGGGAVFTNYYGEFAPKNVVSTETHGGWQAFLKCNLNPRWALRVQFASGQASGHYSNFAAGKDQRALGFVFKNKVKTLVSMLEFEPLSKRYFPGKKKFVPGFSPWVAIGHGLVMHDPQIDFNEGNDLFSEELRKNIEKDKAVREFSPSLLIHLGLGSRFYFSKNISAGIEVALQPVFSDYIDGVSKAGNSKTKDWLMFFGVSAAYILPQKLKDHDHDGIPDNRDDCPEEKGSKKNHGCPGYEKPSDRDGDGVPDSSDRCPDERGNPLNYGCPKKKD